MPRFVTALLLLAVLALPAQAQDGSKFTPYFAPKTPTNFGAAGERGIALGQLAHAGGGSSLRLVVVDQDHQVLRIMDPSTGAELSTISTASLKVGSYAPMDGSITEDGAIVVCNLTLNAVNEAFICHAAPDDGGEFTEIINYTSAAAARLGDKVTVVGSVAGGTLTVYAAAANSGRVYRFDSGNFDSPTILNLVEEDGSTNITMAATPSIGPLGTGVSDFWMNSNSIYPMKFDASGKRIGHLTSIVSGVGNNAIRPISAGGRDFIATFEYTTTAPTYGRVAIVDVTNFPTSAATLYDRGLNTGGGASGLGDVEVYRNDDGTYTVCVLGVSFGVTCGFTNEAPLPVELVAFEGVANGTSVALRWTTASETNNAGFDVQQRIGGDFQTLGFVAGHGTTAEASAYTFEAANLAPGRHTFRLVQRDFDGTISVSPEVEIEVTAEAAFLLSGLQPNPARDAARLNVYVARTQPVTVEMYDAVGRRVAVLFDGVMAEGSTPLLVDAAALPAGLYVIRARGEQFAQTQQLTVIR